MNFSTRVLVFFIKSYQYLLSPLLGQHCRFYPTCSNYGLDVLKKYGTIRGTIKIVCRLCKCHPFHAGGIDLP